MAGGRECVTAAEEETFDDVGGFAADYCSVETAASGGVGREGREEEVEVGLEGAVWLVLDGVCAAMRTVDWR